MGSRAVMIVCRSEEAARRRFGVEGVGLGVCYTRTGRPFFGDSMETELLNRVHAAVDAGGLWEELGTDWICLDCELMPWSAKAKDLLQHQYAPVGTAARAGLGEALAALERVAARDLDTGELIAEYRQRAEMAAWYVDAYRRYCWPVNSVADLKLAPFHLLASEDAAHLNRDHLWHLETIARLHEVDAGIFQPTRHIVVDVTDPASQEEGIRWWEELTGCGGEGMVVKPLEFVARGSRGLAQPALKSRGREYLRIIYGPEYTRPEHLERLRSRNVGPKRSLATREFALGVEGLERFVRREPLRRVHECVFGVLALESEPVDPRL